MIGVGELSKCLRRGIRFIGLDHHVAIAIEIFECPIHQHPIALEQDHCRRRDGEARRRGSESYRLHRGRSEEQRQDKWQKHPPTTRQSAARSCRQRPAWQAMPANRLAMRRRRMLRARDQDHEPKEGHQPVGLEIGECACLSDPKLSNISQERGLRAPLTAFCKASARKGLARRGASGAMRLTASVSL